MNYWVRLEQFLANQRDMRFTKSSVIDDMYKFIDSYSGVAVYMVYRFNMGSINDFLCSVDRASRYNLCK